MSQAFPSSSKSISSSSLPGASLSAPLIGPKTLTSNLTYDGAQSNEDYDVFTYITGQPKGETNTHIIKQIQQNAKCSSYWSQFPQDYLESIRNCVISKTHKSALKGKGESKDACEILTEWFADSSKMRLILECMEGFLADKLFKYSPPHENFEIYNSTQFDMIRSYSCYPTKDLSDFRLIILPNTKYDFTHNKKLAIISEQNIIYIKLSDILLSHSEWEDIEEKIKKETCRNIFPIIVGVINNYAKNKEKLAANLKETIISLLVLRHYHIQFKDSTPTITKYEIIYTKDFSLLEQNDSKTLIRLPSPTNPLGADILNSEHNIRILNGIYDTTRDDALSGNYNECIYKKSYTLPNIKDCIIYPSYVEEKDLRLSTIKTTKDLENFYFTIQKLSYFKKPSICPFVIHLKPPQT